MSGTDTDDDHEALKDNVMNVLKGASEKLLSVSSDPDHTKVASDFEQTCVTQVKRLCQKIEFLQSNCSRKELRMKTIYDEAEKDRKALLVEQKDHEATREALRTANYQVQKWQHLFHAEQSAASALQEKLVDAKEAHQTTRASLETIQSIKDFHSNVLDKLSEDQLKMTANLGMNGEAQEKMFTAIIQLNRTIRAVLRSHEFVNLSLDKVLEVGEQALEATKNALWSERQAHNAVKEVLMTMHLELQSEKDAREAIKVALDTEVNAHAETRTLLQHDQQMLEDKSSNCDSTIEDPHCACGSWLRQSDRQVLIMRSCLTIEEKAHQATRDVLEAERKSHQATRVALRLAESKMCDTERSTYSGNFSSSTVPGFDSNSKITSTTNDMLAITIYSKKSEARLLVLASDYHEREERIKTLEEQLEAEKSAHKNTNLDLRRLVNKDPRAQAYFERDMYHELRAELHNEQERGRVTQNSLQLEKKAHKLLQESCNNVRNSLLEANELYKAEEEACNSKQMELVALKKHSHSIEKMLEKEKSFHDATKADRQAIKKALSAEEIAHKATKGMLEARDHALHVAKSALASANEAHEHIKTVLRTERLLHDSTKRNLQNELERKATKRTLDSAHRVNSDAKRTTFEVEERKRHQANRGVGQDQSQKGTVEEVDALLASVHL